MRRVIPRILSAVLLGRKETDMIYHRMAAGYADIDQYFPEYDSLRDPAGHLHFGDALGGYQTLAAGGTDIYWREFEAGYVFVNPSAQDVTSVPLPGPGKRITHANLASALSSILEITSVDLAAHRSAFVRKSDSSTCSVSSGHVDYCKLSQSYCKVEQCGPCGAGEGDCDYDVEQQGIDFCR